MRSRGHSPTTSRLDAYAALLGISVIRFGGGRAEARVVVTDDATASWWEQAAATGGGDPGGATWLEIAVRGRAVTSGKLPSGGRSAG